MTDKREIIIEDDHVKFARSFGAVCIKGKIEGRAAFPDQLVLMDNKKFYWIEFKREIGGSLQEDQIEMHKLLREKGHTVYVCNTKRHSHEILDKEFS